MKPKMQSSAPKNSENDLTRSIAQSLQVGSIIILFTDLKTRIESYVLANA